jgi:Transposase
MASSRSLGGITPDIRSVMHTVALPIPTRQRIGPPRRIPANADVSDKKLFGMRVDKLREAIQSKQVSFPSQIPTFSKHTRPDLQRKLVQLYFVCGWSRPKIRARYGLSAQRFQQILSTWKNRAIELGLIQTIPPEPNFFDSSMPFIIRVVLSPSRNSPARVVLQNGNKHRQVSKAKEVNGRPRRKCESDRIAEVLDNLEKGRSVTEMASEVGVTPSTVRLWRRQREMEILQRENRELRERVASLSSSERTDRPH